VFTLDREMKRLPTIVAISVPLPKNIGKFSLETHGNMWFRKIRIIKSFGPLKDGRQPLITFCDKNLEICELLADSFKACDQVEVIQGDLLTLKGEGIVSPANSFGDMGGGLDRAIDNYYKGRAQKLLKAEIDRHFFGELPVGMALLVPMETENFNFLIAAPTMRVPGLLRKESINVYLAMRAILVAISRYNEKNNMEIKKIVIPGLGTGVGGMRYKEAVEQMYSAYQNIYTDKWKKIVHPIQAPYPLRK